MNARRAVSLAVLAAVAVSASPSHAATKKRKPPIKGAYTVTLMPDPSANVLSTAGQSDMCGANTAAQDRHAFTVPAAGYFAVTLDAQDPKPGTPYVFDWDVFLLDANGDSLADGNSGEAHEEIGAKFKKGQQVTILSCNLNGVPNAAVSYVFTYA